MKPTKKTAIPKLIGSDTELGNVIISPNFTTPLQSRAATALQTQIEGANTHSFYGGSSLAGYYSGLCNTMDKTPVGATYSSQDSGRKFLPNGGCTYIDMSHYEICTPEVLSATDYVAVWHAMLRISQNALDDASLNLKEKDSLNVTVDNTDRKTSSWGNHTNVMITRDLHDRLCGCKGRIIDLYALASFQASSIIITGAGKTGSEHETVDVDFQISQRADWFECMKSINTTFARPIVNTRDETLATGDIGRLHCIFYDANLCHVATYLRVGMLQLVLAVMEEDGFDRKLILADPLGATQNWSRDPELSTEQELFTGGSVTALQHQFMVLAMVKNHIAKSATDFEDIIPGYKAILSCWEDILSALDIRDWDYLTGILDWVTRRELLAEIVSESGNTWTSPEIQHMDLLYGNLDPQQGLFWNLLDIGMVTELVDSDAIEHFVHIPPENTRAWLRGCLIDLHMQSNSGVTVKAVDWDRINIIASDSRFYRASTVLHLDNPLNYTKEITSPALMQYEQDSDMEELLNSLEELTE